MKTNEIRAHAEHLILHLGMHTSHNGCPECRADCSRRFAAVRQPFKYAHVHEYLSWAQPRIEAIRNGENSFEAIWWQRDFVAALNNRINSHLPAETGRKHAPEYAKYHLATYGNDYNFLHN